MKTAEYYIDTISEGKMSDDEWLKLDEELAEWKKKADPQEVRLFVDEGIGEMLFMICENIKSEHQQGRVVFA